MINLEVIKREKKAYFDDKKQIKGIVYGGDVKENILIFVDYIKFSKIFEEAGMSHIIELNIEGDKKDVLIKEFQLDPIMDTFRHIDFFVLTKGVEIEVEIPLEFIGESPAVKLGNILTKVHTNLKVKCVPKNIPEKFEIDLSILETIENTIRMKDIALPEGVSFVSENMEDVVVSVAAPIEEVVEVIESEDGEGDKTEVTKEEDEDKK